MKAYLFTLFLFMKLAALGQDSLRLNSEDKSGYKKWTDYKTSFRFGLGTQRHHQFSVICNFNNQIFKNAKIK